MGDAGSNVDPEFLTALIKGGLGFQVMNWKEKLFFFIFIVARGVLKANVRPMNLAGNFGAAS